MATYHRVGIFMAVTLNAAIAALIYYRVGRDHLFEIAQNGSAGPFSPVIGTLNGMVPVALTLIVLGTAVWVIAGGVQRERGVARGPRR